MFPKSRRLNSPKIFARNKAEAEHPELWDGLVSAWSPCLSPRGGSTLYDFTGRGRNGVLVNMELETDWSVSLGLPCLSFATNDGVMLPSITLAEMTSGGTIAVWATTNTTDAGTANAFSHRDPNRLYIGRDGTSIYLRGAGSANIAGGSWSVGVMLNLGISWSAFGINTITGWTNGTQNGSASGIVWSGTATEDTSIGAYSSTGVPANNYWSGDIFDVLWWNRQLNNQEWALLYRLGPGGWAERRNTSYFFITPPRVKSLYTPVRTSLGKNFIFRT